MYTKTLFVFYHLRLTVADRLAKTLDFSKTNSFSDINNKISLTLVGNRTAVVDAEMYILVCLAL